VQNVGPDSANVWRVWRQREDVYWGKNDSAVLNTMKQRQNRGILEEL